MEDKAKVITLKNESVSNREVARRTGMNRETVSKYWEKYKRLRHELQSKNVGMDEKRLQEKLLSAPKHEVKGRKKRKHTEWIENRLKEILKEEKQKDAVLGQGHKQSLTNKQIFEKLRDEGAGIGQSTNQQRIVKAAGKAKTSIYPPNV